jgi:4-hydroxythreonine-4-phosphate dehydrogenase
VPNDLRPIIAVTMGDPTGVGPEVVVKALARPSAAGAGPNPILAMCRPVIVGDSARLGRAAELCGVQLDPSVTIIDVGSLPEDLAWGVMSPIGGEAAFRYIERAAEMAINGDVQAICTAPLNKEAMHAAGHLYPGHTELLAALTGTAEVSMMLVAPGLRVVHVTTHIGIIDAIAKIEPGLVARTIRRAHETLQRSGIAAPRLAVCGINPHAGENGLFGNGEEAAKIEPAIAQVRSEGIDAVGPLPADTLFFRARRGDFDCVVAMYHDQGHGPVKVLGLEAGVNITIGLPVVRTSVDHGTAFDIAGTGSADERSMLAALEQAVDLATVAVGG